MRAELQGLAPSHLAAATLAAARHATGTWPPWPDALLGLTGAPRPATRLLDAATYGWPLGLQAPTNKHLHVLLSISVN